MDRDPTTSVALAGGPRDRPLSGLVRRLVAYMHENHAEPIRLRDLKRMTDCTVFQIIRAFRRELGVTPHAYLIAVRTERAASLLLRGGSIAETAAEAGFADQSHLARHLKKRYGATPREFMAQRMAAGTAI
ncbi:MAG: helix-turn-helix transcriptional regulator [Alphaproteobacteria bacterium]|nr:helix-turn-helix transcriptional regulator [Alphaproteobacteria bacterium]